MLPSSVDAATSSNILGGCRLAFCAPAEAAAAAAQPSGWLTPMEAAQWRALATEKRRRDWLGGRLAAKKALAPSAPTSLEILNEASGRPYARFLDGLPAPDISISHCEAGAVCTAAFAGRVGVDLELVAPRAERVLSLYTHEEERRAGLAGDPKGQTLLWTLKEAALKLLGLGLTCDPRDARIRDLGASPPLAFYGAARRRWEELGRPRIKTAWRPEGSCLLAWAWTGGGA